MSTGVLQAARRSLSLCTIVWILALLGAPSAAAHASLVSADPAPGSEQERLPGVLTLTFGGPMQPDPTVILLGPDAEPIALADPVVADGVVTVPLASARSAQGAQGAPATGQPGLYSLVFRATTTDGHPVVGSVDFAVGTTFAGIPPSSRAAGAAVDTATDPAADPVSQAASVDQVPTSAGAGIAARDVVVSSALVAAGAVLWLLGGRGPARRDPTVGPPGP